MKGLKTPFQRGHDVQYGLQVSGASCFMPLLLEVLTGGKSWCKIQGNNQCVGIQDPFSDQPIQDEAPSKCASEEVAAIFGIFSRTEENIL